MEGRIRGSYPGGPRKGSPPPERSRAPRLSRVEEIEAGIARRSLRLSRRRKKRRLAVGLVAALLVSGGFGLLLGVRSHTTPAEIVARTRVSRKRDLDISREVNRTLLQLWQMEDLDHFKGLSQRIH